MTQPLKEPWNWVNTPRFQKTPAVRLFTLGRVVWESRQWLPPPSRVPMTNQILILLSSPWGTNEFIGLIYRAMMVEARDPRAPKLEGYTQHGWWLLRGHWTPQHSIYTAVQMQHLPLPFPSLFALFLPEPARPECVKLKQNCIGGVPLVRVPPSFSEGMSTAPTPTPHSPTPRGDLLQGTQLIWANEGWWQFGPEDRPVHQLLTPRACEIMFILSHSTLGVSLGNPGSKQ